MRHFIVCIVCWIMFGIGVGHCAVSTILADTQSGLILSSQNSLKQQYPASLTKVMTLYLTFNALENGLLEMDDMLPISRHAAKQPPSKLHLKAGRTISVRNAVMALIIKSANDAAVVLAEALAPSEADFAKMMTQTAKKLGLKNTVFRNASGLHNPNQVTTAQDMAVLTIAMINHFPQYYKLFSKCEFSYNGKVYKSHNKVTQNYVGAEGLKTGYIAAVGYNIISTAKRDDKRLVTVVIGQKNTATRDKQAINLLNKGFSMNNQQSSKLRRLSQQGKKLNTKSAVTRPDLKPQLNVMKSRLAQVKKRHQKTDVQLAATTENGMSEQSAFEVMTEIEQGDHNAVLSVSEQVNSNVNQPIMAVSDKTQLPESDLNKTMTVDTDGFKPYQPDTKQLVQKIPVQSMDSNTVALSKTDIETSVVPNDVSDFVAENQKDTTQLVQLENNEMIAVKNDNGVQTVSAITDKPEKKSWCVQVGAFSNKTAAQKQADKAFKFVKGNDKFVKITKNDQIYRSRIYGFKNKQAANTACRYLKSKKINCMPLSPIL